MKNWKSITGLLLAMTDQAESVQVKVHFCKSDLYRAVLTNSMRQPLFWIMPFGVAAGFFAGLTSAAAETSGLVGVYAGAGALIIGVLSFGLIVYLSVRTTIKTPGVLDPITYTFTQDGVTAQYTKGMNQADWSLVRGCYETSRFIFIKMQRGTFHLVPLPQVTSEQATALRAILRTHLPAKSNRFRD